MHTAVELNADLFSVEIDGRPVSREELLGGWVGTDRFGIVVDSPYGAVGSSLLIQLTITSFYDTRPERRDRRPQYPEIYAFHVGQGHGDLSFYDFWPPRKEVVVPDSAAAVLAALNDHAITRLAVPDRPDAASLPLPQGWSSWADVRTAEELLRSAWAYSASGRLRAADVVITGKGGKTEANVSAALDPAGRLAWYRGLSDEEFADALPGPTTIEDMQRWLRSVEGRISEVPDHLRRQAVRLRRELTAGGVASEQYRRLRSDEAIRMLSSNP
jgi:hypothetical protein